MIRENLNVSHYEILGKIGVGGMGTVYKARDTRLHRLVAIKFLKESGEGRDRFFQEARAASSLDHANICTIFEVDETAAGMPFIVMAYYGGGNLKRRLEGNPLPLPEALEICAQIARGLQYASKHGIVHRDIKPGNIMFSEHGVVKIVDFGIAKMAGNSGMTLPGRPMGTMHYMAPEQVEGQKVGFQADIWSLGVVLYEMLTGRLPFPGETHQQVFSGILLHDPLAVSNTMPPIPAEVISVIHKTLCKDPGGRYQRFEALLADLRKVVETLPRHAEGSVKRGSLALPEHHQLSRHSVDDTNPTLPVSKDSEDLSRRSEPLSEEFLELPEGTMDPESPFYVARWGDEMLGKKLKAHQGVTFSIVGPRQIGKSSMLLSLRDLAVSRGRHVAFVDLQVFGKAVLHDGDAFYRQFCQVVTDELDLDDDTDAFWRLPLSNNLRCTRYFKRYLLKNIDQPLLLAMDEVDSLLGAEHGSDFFGMLRSWHNSRRAGSVWKNLDMGLVTSTEPYFLIAHQEQSPFNVGETVALEDFSHEQAADLNERHGNPLDVTQLTRVHELTGGHPYLLRKALYVITSGEIEFPDLMEHAADERGPFGDHLRNYLYKLYGKDELIRGMARLVEGGTLDDWTGVRLKGIGLASRDHDGFRPRCRLYKRFFAQRLGPHTE